MKIDNSLSDEAVLAQIGERLARRRLDLGLTQAQLAARAGVAKRTLERLEAGDVTQLLTLVRVLRELGLLVVLEQALPDAAPRPLEVVRNQGRQRQRATRRKSSRPPQEPWTWAED